MVNDIMLSVDFNLISDTDNRELCQSVLAMFETVPQGMTTFQIQNFVLADVDFPTPDSKWWQAKLELWVRLQNVIHHHYEYKKNVIKMKIIHSRIMELEENRKVSDMKEFEIMRNDAKIELFMVECDELEFSLVLIKKAIADKIKEMWAFWDSMLIYEKKMKYSHMDKDAQEHDFWLAKSKINNDLLKRYPELFKKHRGLHD